MTLFDLFSILLFLIMIMRKIILLLCAVAFGLTASSQIPDISSNETPTYFQVIEAYRSLDSKSDFMKMVEYGMTDAGYPLHLVIINKEKVFDPAKFNKDKVVFLINNAIHPGEPCGVNACLHLAKEMLDDKKIPDNVILAIIPAYNIGGMLNRGSHSRANQNGPKEYGFRGNAQNLDLNRDFIKADSKNAMSFMEIFQDLKPHIFLDTHTSNGADYQYTMTLITSQPEMAGPVIGPFTKNVMTPWLEKDMEMEGWPMAPYVNSVEDTPDKGIADYVDSPRYSTGYTSLFNCLSYVSETHMLKTFADRVKSTRALILSMAKFGNTKTADIIANKMKADQAAIHQKVFPLIWELDTNTYETIQFMGYEAGYSESEVTVGKRLSYDQSKPYTKAVKYFSTYKPTKEVKKPKAYIIPKSWHKVLDRLQQSEIRMQPLQNDSTILVNAYFIEGMETKKGPYEGHYLHYKTAVKTRKQQITFLKGDYLIPCDQSSNKFILETLEPQATDSYFNWNFFDIIMQQKEWFSSYVFEDIAAQNLKNDPELKIAFDEKMKDPKFAKDRWGQMYWLYTKSKHYEPNHKRYPVFRIE